MNIPELEWVDLNSSLLEENFTRVAIPVLQIEKRRLELLMRHHVLTVTSGAAWAAIVNILNSYFMLRWAAIFFIIAIVAAIFGFGGIAEGAASIAKILFFVFVVLFVLALIFGSTFFKK